MIWIYYIEFVIKYIQKIKKRKLKMQYHTINDQRRNFLNPDKRCVDNFKRNINNSLYFEISIIFQFNFYQTMNLDVHYVNARQFNRLIYFELINGNYKYRFNIKRKKK